MRNEVHVLFSEEALSSQVALEKEIEKERKEGIRKSFNQQLLKAIEREKTNLKFNPMHGIHIPRKYLSREIIERYQTDSIWKVDLVGYWRLLYTVKGDALRIMCVVLEFMDHKKYDSLFGYRKR